MIVYKGFALIFIYRTGQLDDGRSSKKDIQNKKMASVSLVELLSLISLLNSTSYCLDQQTRRVDQRNNNNTTRANIYSSVTLTFLLVSGIRSKSNCS